MSAHYKTRNQANKILTYYCQIINPLVVIYLIRIIDFYFFLFHELTLKCLKLFGKVKIIFKLSPLNAVLKLEKVYNLTLPRLIPQCTEFVYLTLIIFDENLL